MIDLEKWKMVVDYFIENRGKKHVRIKCVNGRVYYGTCDGDYEEEDSKGNNVYAIGTENRIFIQEQVEDVEFLD